MNISILSIPADKARHFVFGSLIFAVSIVVAHFAGATMAPLLSLLMVVPAAVAKEASDWYINRRSGKQVHTVELGDVLATVVGGAVCWISVVVAGLTA
jgi:hypothetical protein